MKILIGGGIFFYQNIKLSQSANQYFVTNQNWPYNILNSGDIFLGEGGQIGARNIYFKRN